MTHNIEELTLQRILELGSCNEIVVRLQIFSSFIPESTVELLLSAVRAGDPVGA